MNTPDRNTNSESSLKIIDNTIAHIEYKGRCKKTIYKRISIPARFSTMLFLQIIIQFLKNKTEENYEYLYKFASEAERFFEYLDDHYKTPNEIPTIILQLFATYLSKEKSQKPSSIRSSLGILQVMLEWALDASWMNTVEHKERAFYLAVTSSRPSIPKSDELDGNDPAMSELLPSHNFDDGQLLISLQSFCFGFLKIFQDHRATILNYPEVKERLAELEQNPTKDIDWHFKLPNLQDYDAIFNSIIFSQNETLIERIICSNEKFRKISLESESTDSLETLYKKIKTCVRTKSTGTILPISKLTESAQYLTFEGLDLRSLLSACEAEEICLRWLLASDRIQLSGQELLTLEDVDVTVTHATVNYLKNRAEPRERVSTMHHRASWQYKILSYYKKLKIRFDELYPTVAQRPGMFFQYETPFSRRQNLSSISYRPLFLACWPQTHAAITINDSNPGADYFQKYYQLLIQKNSVHYRNRKAANSPRLDCDTDDAPQNNSGEITNTSLTANVIGVSRTIVSYDHPVSTSPFDRFSRVEVSADSTAHTPWTKEFIYKHRSMTVHRITARGNFVEAVGHLQVVDAQKLAFLAEKTKCITLDEINDVLGLKINLFSKNAISDFNYLVTQLEAKNYTCTPFGYFQSKINKNRIIIILPVTAALIISYKFTCESELTKADSAERRMDIALKYAYADFILTKFDQRTIEEGKSILATHKLPTPFI
jgi:hypothetical protein